MEARVLFSVTLVFLFLSGTDSAKITIQNNCPYTIWPGILTSNNKPQLSTTGFELPSKSSSSLDVPPPWVGQFWARTHCSTNSGNFTCATADCNSGQVACNGNSAIPPASLVEFGLATIANQDLYDVSLVDGFNLPVSVSPQGGSGPCQPASCPGNVNTVCPTELAVKGSDGSVIGCKNPCEVFNEPQYCCTLNCPATNYSSIFKQQCPQAYANDDLPSSFTCSSGANYTVKFCP